MTVTVKNRQTLSDIAIQVYGDIRAIAVIIEANELSATDELEPGIEIICPEVVYNPYFQTYVSKKNIRPACALDPDGDIPSKMFTREFTEQFK